MTNHSLSRNPRQATRGLSYRNPIDELERLGQLTRTGARLMRFVADFNSRGAPCFVSTATFAYAFGLAEKTVVNQVSLLVRAGWLLRSWQRGRRVLSLNHGLLGHPSKSQQVGTVRVAESQRPEPEEQPKDQAVSATPETATVVDSGIRFDPAGWAPVASPDVRVPTEPEPRNMEPFVSSSPRDARAPSETALGLQTRLRRVVETGRRIRVAAKPRTWARDMDGLLRDVDGDVARVEAVLAWYAAHLHDRYCPRADTAEKFRAKFAQLEAAMQRGTIPNPPAGVAGRETRQQGTVPPPLDPGVRDALEQVSNYTWEHAPDLKQALPDIAARSLANARAFAARLRAPGGPLEAEALLAWNAYWDPVGVVGRWLVAVAEKSREWKDRRAGPDYFVWDPRHRWVSSEVRRAACLVHDPNHPDQGRWARFLAHYAPENEVATNGAGR